LEREDWEEEMRATVSQATKSEEAGQLKKKNDEEMRLASDPRMAKGEGIGWDQMGRFQCLVPFWFDLEPCRVPCWCRGPWLAGRRWHRGAGKGNSGAALLVLPNSELPGSGG